MGAPTWQTGGLEEVCAGERRPCVPDVHAFPRNSQAQRKQRQEQLLNFSRRRTRKDPRHHLYRHFLQSSST
jgi:hypothetical protein